MISGAGENGAGAFPEHSPFLEECCAQIVQIADGYCESVSLGAEKPKAAAAEDREGDRMHRCVMTVDDGGEGGLVTGVEAADEFPVRRGPDAVACQMECAFGRRRAFAGDGLVNGDHAKGSARAPVGTWGDVLAWAGRCDLAFVTINGKGGNMSVADAVELVGRLRPRLANPMHYGMFAEGAEDPNRFLDGGARWRSRAVCFRSGVP